MFLYVKNVHVSLNISAAQAWFFLLDFFEGQQTKCTIFVQTDASSRKKSHLNHGMILKETVLQVQEPKQEVKRQSASDKEGNAPNERNNRMFLIADSITLLYGDLHCYQNRR